MRKFLISAALLSAAAISAPAAAQYYGRGYDRGYGYNYDRGGEIQIGRELDRLHDRIDRSAYRGRLSPNETYRLQRHFDSLSRRFERYRYNGLSSREYYDLERRIANLHNRLQHERRDGYRYRAYGW